MEKQPIHNQLVLYWSSLIELRIAWKNLSFKMFLACSKRFLNLSFDVLIKCVLIKNKECIGYFSVFQEVGGGVKSRSQLRYTIFHITLNAEIFGWRLVLLYLNPCWSILISLNFLFNNIYYYSEAYLKRSRMHLRE